MTSAEQFGGGKLRSRSSTTWSPKRLNFVEEEFLNLLPAAESKHHGNQFSSLFKLSTTALNLNHEFSGTAQAAESKRRSLYCARTAAPSGRNDRYPTA